MLPARVYCAVVPFGRLHTCLPAAVFGGGQCLRVHWIDCPSSPPLPPLLLLCCCCCCYCGNIRRRSWRSWIRIPLRTAPMCFDRSFTYARASLGLYAAHLCATGHRTRRTMLLTLACLRALLCLPRVRERSPHQRLASATATTTGRRTFPWPALLYRSPAYFLRAYPVLVIH